MPARENPFVTHCLELLGPLGGVRSRRMFGGHGIYIDELFIAIIAFEQLYLKVDTQTREQFLRAGCVPFVYEGKSQPVTMSYWRAPAQALESPALMQRWARLAIDAALRSRAAASKVKPRRASSKTRR